MKNRLNLAKSITMFSQLSISLIMPILICIALCWWLTSRFDWPVWIYIPGFFFGMGSSAMVAYKFYLTVMKEQKTEEKKSGKKKRVSFNRHS